MTRYACVKFRLRSGERTFLFRRQALDTPRSPPSLRSLRGGLVLAAFDADPPAPSSASPELRATAAIPAQCSAFLARTFFPTNASLCSSGLRMSLSGVGGLARLGAAASAARASTVASHAAASFSNASIVAATAAFGGSPRALASSLRRRALSIFDLTSLARFSSARVTTPGAKESREPLGAQRRALGLGHGADRLRAQVEELVHAQGGGDGEVQGVREAAQGEVDAEVGGSEDLLGCIPRSRCRRRWRGVRGRR